MSSLINYYPTTHHNAFKNATNARFRFLVGGWHRASIGAGVLGQLNQAFSLGCNKLIRENKAQIYTRPQDLIEAVRWDAPAPSVPPHGGPCPAP